MTDTSSTQSLETRTYLIQGESFILHILQREGWREAPKGAQPDFSMLPAPMPLLGKAPPVPPALKKRSQEYRLQNPPRPLAPIRMHAAPGLLALNDKVSFWLQLKEHGLMHLHPFTLSLEDVLSTGLATEGENLTALRDGHWFLKKRLGSNGRDVKCFRGYEALEEHVKKEPKFTTYASQFLVQSGICPFLIDGKKAVFRIFVLVLGQRIYVHREFLIKLLGGEYSEDTDDCNTHVDCCAGEQGVQTIRGTEWSGYEQFFPKVRLAAEQVLAAHANVLEPEPDLDGCRFSLIGLDVLLTSDCEPKVLEANCPPALFEIMDEVAKLVKIEVQEDFYRFVIVGGGSPDAASGGFKHEGARD